MLSFEREFSKQKTNLADRAAAQSLEQERRDIFESHRHRAFALAFYMTGNEMEAETILTDTFVRAFQQAERPDAYTVDSALVAELSRRFSLRQEQTEEAVASGPRLGLRNVRRNDLEAAVQSLPANERLLFLLREVEGYSPEWIAKLLEIPQQQVERSLFSARLRLRQLLAALAETAPEAA